MEKINRLPAGVTFTNWTPSKREEDLFMRLEGKVSVVFDPVYNRTVFR